MVSGGKKQKRKRIRGELREILALFIFERRKFMSFVQYVIAFLILYICVYALINRVCQCIEHCATAKAYSKFRENGVLVKMNDVKAGIIKSKKEKDDVKETIS